MYLLNVRCDSFDLISNPNPSRRSSTELLARLLGSFGPYCIIGDSCVVKVEIYLSAIRGAALPVNVALSGSNQAGGRRLHHFLPFLKCW